MSGPVTTEALVMRYFTAWQTGDLAALRNCLAERIRFDWGTETYTDPDQFVAASAAGIVWRDVRMLSALYGETRAAIMYEAVNRTDGVRIRASEFLRIDQGVISEAFVVYTTLGPA